MVASQATGPDQTRLAGMLAEFCGIVADMRAEMVSDVRRMFDVISDNP